METKYCRIQGVRYPVRIIHCDGTDWFCGQDIINLVNNSVGPNHHYQIERDVKPQNRQTMYSLGIHNAGIFEGCVISPHFYFLDEIGVYQLLIQRRRRAKAADVCSWFGRLVDELKQERNQNEEAMNE